MCVGLLLKIYNSTVLCIVEFTGHLLSDRDTTSSTRMGAGGNGNKTKLDLGNENEPLGMGRNKTEKPFSLNSSPKYDLCLL